MNWYQIINRKLGVTDSKPRMCGGGRKIRIQITDAQILAGEDKDIILEALKDEKGKSVFVTKHYNDIWNIDVTIYD